MPPRCECKITFNPDQLQDWPEGNSFMGSGAFGVVHKKLYCGMPVAVKTMLFPENASNSTKYTMEIKFMSEIDKLTNYRHPHIAAIIAHTRKLVVMELYDGSLSNVKNIHDLVLVGRDCLRALSYMQYHNEECRTHGDIKPDNILVNKDLNGNITNAALADFGMSGDCTFTSSAREFVGTPGFMPFTYDQRSSGLADIHALAVSLIDSYSDKDVRTFHPDGIEDNTVESLMSIEIPEDVRISLKSMLQAHDNEDLARKEPKFILFLLNKWESMEQKYRR